MSAPPGSPAASSESAAAEELISIARIVRPQGRRGEVIAELLTDFPERFAKLDVALVKLSSGQISRLRLETSWFHQGRIVLKFAGCDSISQAEELRDAQLFVTREQLVELPLDTYYDFDLVDCEVVTTGGELIGRVTDVQRYGAAPLLAVQDEERREHLIPFVLSICLEIDISRKRITVNPPEGLLEL
ncbi:MAG: ribosome maturation factor RimM [Acidobacteria bacterium]|nr:ribosome maturation factor RimM [Acidobacteriota bacterium]